jgi:hypothetical protein
MSFTKHNEDSDVSALPLKRDGDCDFGDIQRQMGNRAGHLPELTHRLTQSQLAGQKSPAILDCDTSDSLRNHSTIPKHRSRTCRRDRGLAWSGDSVWRRWIKDRRRSAFLQWHVATPEFAFACASSSAFASTPDGRVARRNRCAKHNGGKRDNCSAPDGLLLDVLKEIHDVHSSDFSYR